MALTSGVTQPYRLVRGQRPAAVPVQLDEQQRAVVEHDGGPLLVLAGPGTGKTTTLVEAVAARVAGGLAPDQVLLLTFSRKAAAELRTRITARLTGTAIAPAVWTFHAFCYAVVREHSPADAWAVPPRLLSGPEQDVAVRELLAGQLAEGRAAQWPRDLRGCLGLRGFADELRALIARARTFGFDPDQLRAIADSAQRLDWSAAAGFMAEYLDVLDARGAIDYTELVRRAVALASRPDIGADLRRRYAAVYVDEYQDTDPGQEQLLHHLAGGGRDLVVVGDPDQSIYAFRGADVRGILRFPERFPTADGARAPIVALRRSRRCGPVLLAASRAVAARLPLAGLRVDVAREHRDLSAEPGAIPGEVVAVTYPNASAERAAIADLLRRAHLDDGVPWRSMAVLVRSGVLAIPALQRELTSAGVPVEVASDELPLVRERAVAPLLLALRCADDPTELTEGVAASLLLSPLGGADPADVRRLGRALRQLERERGNPLPPPSAELVRVAVADPRSLLEVADWIAAPAQRLGALLAKAAKTLTDGGTPEDALWALWDGTPWPRRLAATADGTGPAARAANHDLDAIVALFDTVAHTEERQGRRGVANLVAELEAQQIPGDTLAERAVRADAVRLLTAHRAKGLEWDVVVVPGVQEGVWPDPRPRGSLLAPDRLDADGVCEPPTTAQLLAEERRLFYVACTRARRWLVVTAVDSADDDGERPSRFLGELGVDVDERGPRPRRPLTLTGLVAALRAAAVDPDVAPATRAAAADRLALLADATDEAGAALVPAANPDVWWGLADRTDPGESPWPQGEIRLSGSSLSTLAQCPLRWFLDHEARASSARGTAVGFGSVVHALADEVGRGELAPETDALMARLDTVWDALAFEAPWRATQERDAARAALGRFVKWHLNVRGRTQVATEQQFETQLEIGGAVVTLRGRVDRLEVDEGGRLHVVDFKTGKYKAKNAELEHHPQLGVYQAVANAGAFDGLVGPGVPCGGAELVQLRHDAKAGSDLPAVQAQTAFADSADDGAWFTDLLATAVAYVLGERFPATPGEWCNTCPFKSCCPAWPEGRQVVA